jgi:hypothetical protein
MELDSSYAMTSLTPLTKHHAVAVDSTPLNTVGGTYSPDGSMIAYTSRTQANSGPGTGLWDLNTGTSNLWWMSTDLSYIGGGQLTQNTATTTVTNPRWGPDGNSIFFSSTINPIAAGGMWDNSAVSNNLWRIWVSDPTTNGSGAAAGARIGVGHGQGLTVLTGHTCTPSACRCTVGTGCTLGNNGSSTMNVGGFSADGSQMSVSTNLDLTGAYTTGAAAGGTLTGSSNVWLFTLDAATRTPLTQNMAQYNISTNGMMSRDGKTLLFNSAQNPSTTAAGVWDGTGTGGAAANGNQNLWSWDLTLSAMTLFSNAGFAASTGAANSRSMTINGAAPRQVYSCQ